MYFSNDVSDDSKQEIYKDTSENHLLTETHSGGIVKKMFYEAFSFAESAAAKIFEFFFVALSNSLVKSVSTVTVDVLWDIFIHVVLGLCCVIIAIVVYINDEDDESGDEDESNNLSELKGSHKCQEKTNSVIEAAQEKS